MDIRNTTGRGPRGAWRRWGPCLWVLAAALGGCVGPVPPSAATQLRRAMDACRAGDDEAAIELADRFIAAHGAAQEAGEAYYLRGLIRCRRGDRVGGEADFRCALALTRRGDLAGRVRLTLAEGARARGDGPSARAHYLEALTALEPTDRAAERALFGLATLLQQGGEWLEADRYFDRLAWLFPQGAVARQAAGRVRARFWTLQAGLFDDPDFARALAGQLRRPGRAVRVRPVGVSRPRWVVQAGRYPTYAKAAAASEGLRPRIASVAVVAARP